MIAKRITATAISAIRITASRISAAISDKLCRYFFTFNGDGYITTDRRWNPDATDPSFKFIYTGDIDDLNETEFAQSIGIQAYLIKESYQLYYQRLIIIFI